MRANFFLKSKIDAVSCISGLKRLKSRAAWYVSFWSFHSVKSKQKRIPEIVYYNETHSLFQQFLIMYNTIKEVMFIKCFNYS